MANEIPTAARRARWGVILLFWLNGVSWASLLPRYPEIKDSLAFSDQWWGVAVAVGPVGGLLAGMLTAALIRRFASANVAVISQFVSIGLLCIVGTAPAPWVFASGIFIWAGFDSITDISMNAHGMRVQKLYGRPILNSFHGWWSLGAVCGGVVGSASKQAGIPVWLQCVVAASVYAMLSVCAKLLLLPGHDHDVNAQSETHRRRRIPGRLLARLLALGFLGAFAGLLEDTGATWGAIYLDREFTIIPFLTGMAFVALQGTQLVGRFTGDALVRRLGPLWASWQGAAVAGAGMAVALIWATPATTIVGFACVGWGVATMIPSSMHAADELPGMNHGDGLMVVTSMMRIGFLAGPPLIGMLSEATELRLALWVIPVFAVAIAVLTPSLKPVDR